MGNLTINLYNIVIVSFVYILCFTTTFSLTYWLHSRENKTENFKVYLLNIKTISIFVFGLLLINLAMVEFLDFPQQRLKVFGLILLFTSLNYFFSSTFLRIDKKIDSSQVSDNKILKLINKLDNQADTTQFAQTVGKFFKTNYDVSKFLMYEINEDIEPFYLINEYGNTDELKKEVKLNYEVLYNILNTQNSSYSNIIQYFNPELKKSLLKQDIQLALPLSHNNFPIAIIFAGSTSTINQIALSTQNWDYFIKQTSTRLELRRMIEREVNIQKMAELGTMSSQLAHDFKSFLAMVNLYIEDNPIIKKHVNYMNKLVKDLSAYARSTISEKIKLNINEIIELALETTHIPENISVQKQLDANLPSSLVDPLQLQRIFVNLIENSVRAMPTGGKIKASTRTLRATTSNNKPWVYIEFKDEGPGILEENLQKIFEPFYTTYKKEGGTGMGLAISRQIIKHHSGFIDVTSKVNKGTIFNIRLPGITGDKDV